MAENPYKPLVYALSALVTQPQPPQPGSEAFFAIHHFHGITAVARGCRRTARPLDFEDKC